ncbi:unannotated protein [freshwater metagenome]|uniref:Unannotated protein n=1 Tax=freshwater metagenome TaxID=449393 RepID=A0A6J6PKT3_9ZZZZ
MSALGFAPATARLYDQLLVHSGRELVSVAGALLVTTDELVKEVAPLVEHRIVRIEDARLFILTPAETVSAVLQETASSAARAQSRLEDIVRAIPFLTASNARPRDADMHSVEPIDGEISTGGAPAVLLTSLIRESSGDLLWLRPDLFRVPAEDVMAPIVEQAVAAGRRSRAIYPVRALTEARDTLEFRASIGEQIRLLPDVVTRMVVLGTTHVILPEPLGMRHEPRSLVRQRGLVDAMTLWFEAMWERASPLPSNAGGIETRPDLQRFLLQQLAAGAQDEQIARRLGVSLRTVRRRVADMMTELGADTRFQAGVEAARRGWI